MLEPQASRCGNIGPAAVSSMEQELVVHVRGAITGQQLNGEFSVLGCMWTGMLGCEVRAKAHATAAYFAAVTDV
jgi:hypothetical protein